MSVFGDKKNLNKDIQYAMFLLKSIRIKRSKKLMADVFHLS